MMTIQSWDELPAFASEDEEADFWATHDLGQRVLNYMRPISLDGGGELPPARGIEPSSRTRPVPVRLDDGVLRRLKALAARKNKGYPTPLNKGYPTPLKEFVVEGLYEEEKREGFL